jgi:hypothetical protein
MDNYWNNPFPAGPVRQNLEDLFEATTTAHYKRLIGSQQEPDGPPLTSCQELREHVLRYSGSYQMIRRQNPVEDDFQRALAAATQRNRYNLVAIIRAVKDYLM